VAILMLGLLVLPLARVIKPTIQLTVLDAKTGQPVANAKVHVAYLIRPGEFRSAESATDAKGQCLVKVNQGPFAKMGLTVFASGYCSSGVNLTPQAWTNQCTLRLSRPVPLPQIAGKVLLPDGQVPFGAEVAICPPNHWDNIWSLRRMYLTTECNLDPPHKIKLDPEGRFSTNVLPDDEGMIVVHDFGYAQVRLAELQTNRTIVLQPWAEVEGVLLSGQTPAAHKTVILGRPRQHSPVTIRFIYAAETDDNGRFHFERVPAGTFLLGRGFVSTEDSPPTGVSHMVSIETRAGETAQVTLGGNGRLVVGKLVKPKQSGGVDWLEKRHALVPLSPDVSSERRGNTGRDEAQRNRRGELAKAEPKYYLELNADGTFRVEDVPPGTYRFAFHVDSRGGDIKDMLCLPRMLWREEMSAQGFEVGFISGFRSVTSEAWQSFLDKERAKEREFGELTNPVIIAEAPPGRSAEPVDLGILQLQRPE
jgi:hypothetical protein